MILHGNIKNGEQKIFTKTSRYNRLVLDGKSIYNRDYENLRKIM